MVYLVWYVSCDGRHGLWGIYNTYERAKNACDTIINGHYGLDPYINEEQVISE